MIGQGKCGNECEWGFGALHFSLLDGIIGPIQTWHVYFLWSLQFTTYSGVHKHWYRDWSYLLTGPKNKFGGSLKSPIYHSFGPFLSQFWPLQDTEENVVFCLMLLNDSGTVVIKVWQNQNYRKNKNGTPDIVNSSQSLVF